MIGAVALLLLTLHPVLGVVLDTASLLSIPGVAKEDDASNLILDIIIELADGTVLDCSALAETSELADVRQNCSNMDDTNLYPPPTTEL